MGVQTRQKTFMGEEEEKIKYFAARSVWRRRFGYSPKGVRWDRWWSKKFGEDYDLYVQKMLKKREEVSS